LGYLTLALFFVSTPLHHYYLQKDLIHFRKTSFKPISHITSIFLPQVKMPHPLLFTLEPMDKEWDSDFSSLPSAHSQALNSLFPNLLV
jgi:hypothetical protein